ncbi:phospholipase A and acyltransferase 3-like isoform 3-T3 [Hipposideros larvatus]
MLSVPVSQFFEEPEPGDMIEIFHIGYKDWAIYVGDGDVIHLAPPSEFPRFGSSNMFIFLSGTAVVTKESLRNAAWGCLYRVNNFFDHKFRPRPVNEIINSAKKMSDQYPIPGDMIEIDRYVYKHWAIYVGDGCVVHVTTTGSGSFSNNNHTVAKVKCEPLKDVVRNNDYTVNNYLDNKYRPRPIDEIVNSAKQKIGENWHYNVLMSNCEHFATTVRYGRPHSEQGTNAMRTMTFSVAVPIVLLI